MHFNFHFLRFLCPELDAKFKGMKILTCFSQNKDELIIGCGKADESELYFRANLLPSISCMDFPESFKRGKKNTVSLFPDLLGKTIYSIQTVSYERAFQVILETGEILLFKLHGNRSNILYYPKDRDLPELLFRNDLKDDRLLSLTQFPKNFEISYARFEELEGNASKFLPTLGKIPREWLLGKGYIDSDIPRKWQLMLELMDMLESPLFSIIKDEKKHVLSLLPEEQSLFQTSDPILACKELFRYVVVIQAFDSEKNHWIKVFEDQKRKSLAYISKTQQKLEELEQESSPSQLADVIMANLHQIDPKESFLKLFDFYSQNDVIINFKRGQSPQKFAENLYRKSKNRKIELQQLQENLQEKQKLNTHLNQLLDELHPIRDFKNLKEFIKNHNLIIQEKNDQEQLPFKRFECEGFEILVGKSAKGNDEMLRRYTWKEDLWLHAKDVSGSHVLVKYKSGMSFPKSVVERAAELAAYYSKSKNDSLAAVTYTPAKFVRKIKGSQAGAVMVDKESVLLVNPKGPS